MYVAIDMQTLRVLHAHPNQEISYGLLYLEGARVQHAAIVNSECSFFLDSLTSLELALLYRNLTGGEFPPVYEDLSKRQVIAEIVDLLPARSVDLEELETQIRAVEKTINFQVENAKAFRYVKGSNMPSLSEQGFFPITVAPASLPQLSNAAQIALQRRKPRPAATHAIPLQKTPRQRAAPQPRTLSGSRVIIFAEADRMWEAAGKPMHTSVVLELRKKMMSELEKQGIKKSTSSGALGEWMNQRLSC